jgi:threonine dehydratase
VVKREAVIGYGGVVTACDPTSEAREREAQAIVDRSGAFFIHPSNEPLVMSGQVNQTNVLFTVR